MEEVKMLPDTYSNTFKILGMDPGSNKFGFAVLEVDADTLKIVSVRAWTLDANSLLENYPQLVMTHGERAAKIYAIQVYIIRLLYSLLPLFVATESPFINNRFPQAGIALTEVVTAIRNALIEYDPSLALAVLPPSSVKNAVKAKGNADKDIMKEKVIALDLPYEGLIPMVNLDEHSIDATAVSYTKWLEISSGKE